MSELEKRQEKIARTFNKYKNSKINLRTAILEVEQLINEARIDEVDILHKKIDMKFDLIERIQKEYKGDKYIHVILLQNLIAEHRKQLNQLTKGE